MKAHADKKTQKLNPLLSAAALGLLLESCYGSSSPLSPSSAASPPLSPLSPLSPVSVGGGTVSATGNAEAFTGTDRQDDRVFYAVEGVTIDLQTPANNRGNFVERYRYTAIEDLTDYPFDDYITSYSTTESGKTLEGGAGDDILEGGAGDDTLKGGEGDDTLKGGEGDDILEGGAGNDILEGGVGNDTLEGGEGDDTLEGGVGADEAVFREGFGNDILLGGLDGDKLSFKDVTDLKAFSFLHPRGGDVVIAVGSDSVRILAANYAHGRYTLCYGPDDKQTGKLYIGTPDEDASLAGSAEADWIIGLDNDDRLFGEGGEDILYGGAGDDILEGGAGNDILEGDAGTDTYVFRTGFGHDTLQGETDNSKLSFEDAIGHGSFNFKHEANGDAIISVGSDSVVIKSAAYANNRYEICASNDRSFGRLSLGTDSDDGALQGTAAVDWMFGFLGDDTLRGAAGGDNLVGGAGNDKLYGEADRDFLFGGAGNDELYGGAGNDNLHGNNGNDDLDGGVGNDNLYGNGGDDELYGGAGNDNLHGNNGNDDLDGGVGNDNLYGNGGDDELYGNDGNDDLDGGAGNDNLYGNDGNDELYGGAGDDTMQGDAGADRYLFEVGDGEDTISDQQGDSIFLQFVIGAASIAFAETDFTTSTIRRVDDNLEIILDKDSGDGITDKVTILNAYDTDTSTGTGNAAFTIHISFGSVNASTQVTDEFWHTL